MRRAAGYGCCVCGLPVYEYHHIEPWSAVRAHETSNLMLLCPLHHDQATKGALSEEEQRVWQAGPHNVLTGCASGLLVVNQSYCAVEAGIGVIIVGEGASIAVDDEPLLALERAGDGRLLISLRLYDETDRLIAEIAENEWVAGDAGTWDMQSDWRWLKLNLASHDIALRIDARREPVQLRGRLWRKGRQIRMGAQGLAFGANGIAELGLVGFGIRLDSSTGSAALGPPPGSHAMIVSEPDRLTRLAKCLEALDQLRRGNPEPSPLFARPGSGLSPRT